jgi:hypothetical protein
VKIVLNLLVIIDLIAWIVIELELYSNIICQFCCGDGKIISDL